MSKHTPGPWIVHTDGRSIESGLDTVCTFPLPVMPYDNANAKLIAAAPDMAALLNEWRCFVLHG